MTGLIHIHPADSVAVALRDIPKGTVFHGVAAKADIPQGHKMALKPIAAGESITKYGCRIGYAVVDIAEGEWVHTHNLITGLEGECAYTYRPSFSVPDTAAPASFRGFRRKNGAVGIRNEIWIIPTVGCVNGIAEALAKENQDLVEGSVEGLFAFPHPYGCSQTGADHATTRKLLAALAKHPNAGAVLVVSLGCENLTVDQFTAELGEYDPERIAFLTCQKVEDEMEEGRVLLQRLAAYAGGFRRSEIPADELVIGLKCGGSDGLSGVTANPAVGRFSDLLTAQGGSAILTEVPEMFGAEQFLLERCTDETVFQKAVDMVNGFKHYYLDHHESVYENPSPGNRAGGITTLEDKSCGCIQKGGSAPVTDVIGYGESVTRKGLNLLNGPGNDLVSVTALAAAGAHMVLFTTGRGTPFGAPVPTVKIATNTPLAEKKPGWIDLNAGGIADGNSTIEETARYIMETVLQVASGKQTKNEQQGYRGIAIWKDGVTL